MSYSAVIADADKSTQGTARNRPGTHVKRLDIQGMRALAVSLVALFHLRATLMPGGYIGVDVFFVISGFLITGQMLREVERSGTINVLEFWARRVRRLLPAAFLVLVFSAVAIMLLFEKTAWKQNLLEIAFAAAYVLNFRLASESVDYLARDNQASIAQHYWSLSVEEQFYIVVPLLIILVVWLSKRFQGLTKKKIVFAVLLLITVVSFGYSIHHTYTAPAPSYFVTTTRAWEFTVGGLVASVPGLSRALSERWRALLSWVSLGAIVGSAFLFSGATAFPGYMAAIPVIAAAFLLWSGDSAKWYAPQKLTHCRLIELIGDTSYSIYLWHWPLIIIWTHFYGAPSILAMLGLGVVMTILAVLSKEFIEDPIRKAPGRWRDKLPTFGFMLAGVALLLGMTVLPTFALSRYADSANTSNAKKALNNKGCFGANAVVNKCKDPYSFTPGVDPVLAKDEVVLNWKLPSTCKKEVHANWEEFTCDNQKNGQKVALIGDSHAWHFYPGLDALAQDRGWHLQSWIRMACEPFIRGAQDSPDANMSRCSVFNDMVEKQLFADDSIKTVIIGIRADPLETMGDNAAALVAPLQQNAVNLLNRLHQAGKKVYVVRTVPGMPFTNPREKAPDCVARNQGQRDACASTREGVDWLVETVKKTPAKLIDTDSLFCADGRCHVLIGSTVAYSDDNHLTKSFSLSMKSWWEKVIPRDAKP
ncbi:acyltransferase [Mobiluncus mulieris]|uniref:SGNH hydrolase domain-containing protein n=1 Tax=Mobiluncus mulieris TaxID=2052 RepID=UPI0014702F88|nr:acyltransferase [Mobiluncus mulieris]